MTESTQRIFGATTTVALVLSSLSLTSLVLTSGCADDDGDTPPTSSVGCDAEPVRMVTADGTEFVRTPDACFDGLPDWPYAPQYVEIDGLRQAYVDEGPQDGQVVLLLHGQPSWSYLYRKMIPVLVAGGYRVIAMDHLGMGRSDKPTDIDTYSFLGHYERLEKFVEALQLTDIHLFCQDWGSLIGLRMVGLRPELFARVAVGNGDLPVVPANVQPYPPVQDPNAPAQVVLPFAQIPDQQPPFYDGCELLGGDTQMDTFAVWMAHALKDPSFRPSVVLEALTWFDLPTAVEAAYDAPYPSRVYMGGPRTFPSLVNDLPGINGPAWDGLTNFDKPFVTIWAANDPGGLGRCETQEKLTTNVPGAAGQAHVRLPEASHFLQDDQGAEIARRLVEFYDGTGPRPLVRGSRYCEILLVRRDGSETTAEVWGTPGVNDCPAAAWDALDQATIQAETGAVAVVFNGPRFWLPDRTTGSGPMNTETRVFGDLRMRRLATVVIDNPAQMGGDYQPTTVLRTTTFTFNAGVEIYELTDPNGAVHVMQSMSQIVNSQLELTDLAGLGSQLMLPQGWTYTSRTLDAPLILTADGEATVVQDELRNTYQSVATSSTSTNTPGLPVLPDGTGTPCSSDTDCAGLTASHCLTMGQGGFCTIEGCMANQCGAPFVCCHECNEAFAAFLPFEGGACIPEPATSQLTGMAGCTCE